MLQPIHLHRGMQHHHTRIGAVVRSNRVAGHPARRKLNIFIRRRHTQLPQKHQPTGRHMDQTFVLALMLSSGTPQQILP